MIKKDNFYFVGILHVPVYTFQGFTVLIESQRDFVP
jgi:hypothetical protein